MAAVALPATASAVPYAVISAPSLAQKRRLENGGAGYPQDAANKAAKVESAVAPIVTVRRTSGARRPQRKYDPSVPMTKEETSAWRREQRRKRNRESAAACRRRQRDRIAELEAEVAAWKAKFDDALSQLQELDGDEAAALEEELETLAAFPPKRCRTPPVPEGVVSLTIPVQGSAHMVTPMDRPKFVPPIVTSNDQGIGFPVLKEGSFKANLGGVVPSDSLAPRVENRAHFRPAVKIAGAPHPPLIESIESVCDDLLRVVPDSCLSLTEKNTMPFPEACPSLVPQVAVSGDVGLDLDGPAAAVTTDESDEDSDLGEFLMDAVQWL